MRREGFGTLAAVLFGAVVTELLQREQRARAELAAAHERLLEHAAQAERLATAQERNGVARDIHDGLGHSLTVVGMQVKAARAVLPTDPVRADTVLEKAQEQAEAALAEVRRSVSALREPRAVPPLREELYALAEETSAAGVPTPRGVGGGAAAARRDPRGAVPRRPGWADERAQAHRRHPRRPGAGLRRRRGPPRGPRRRDGGSGDGGTPGFGLVGLRERAVQLGGRLQLDSAPGRGSTLSTEVAA